MTDEWTYEPVQDDNDAPGKSIDAVYDDRNVLACALVASADLRSGWKPADDTDDSWALVWVETPHGQASWHVPRDQAAALLERNDDFEYDGHDRGEKNSRVVEWVLNDL